MIKSRLILIVIILAIAPAGVLGQKITKETIISEGKKRTYYLYVPASVKKETPVPLVVLLHGSNRVGLSLAEKWKDLASKEGFIIVAPDSSDSKGWGIPTDGPAFIHELVETLKTRYPVNPRRVHLFGHSAGASFALLMAVYESEYFASIAIHAGALDPDGTVLVRIAKRKIPIYIQVGDRDPLFPVSIVRETRDVLKTAGFPVELREIPNHDHWYYDLASKINLMAWEFLNANELAGEPFFEEHKFRKETGRGSNASAEHYNRGMERMRANDPAGAISAFSRAIEIDGKHAEAYNNRAVAYARQRNFEAAVADLTSSIAARPTEEAYNNRAGIYFNQRKMAEAIADFSEAIKIKPSAESYANRGMAYTESGKEDLGLADYERAIQLNPKLGRAFVLRGLMALKKGEVESAQKDFDMGFKLDPQLHAEFDAIISQIRASRGLN